VVAQRYDVMDLVVVIHQPSADKGNVNKRRTPIVVKPRLPSVVQQYQVQHSHGVYHCSASVVGYTAAPFRCPGNKITGNDLRALPSRMVHKNI